jgi:enoyl-CoA hydratase/carnithine racemase
MRYILFEKKGPIGHLILNRPDQRNALSIELMKEIYNKLEEIAVDRSVKVIIIKANGPDFCAGHDMNELVGKDLEHYRKIFSISTNMMKKLHEIPQPVIAQVHGIATAAGCQLVAACDLAIADTNAKFATPGVKIGLFCTTPMVPLCRIIGRRRALDMLFTGRFVSSTEAEKIGLINKIVEIERLSDETENWAMEIAQYSLSTLEFGKRAFYKQIDYDELEAYNYAKEEIAKNCLSNDAQEGIKAALEKRKPDWKEP